MTLPPDQFIAGLKRIRDELGTCPHPSKTRFKTQEYAQVRAAVLGYSAYECVCGYWHLTSQLTSQQSINECPICGCPLDENTNCGCYDDLHFGD